jgi:signal transduction histidine kinase/CheY-like chemotaxis protein
MRKLNLKKFPVACWAAFCLLTVLSVLLSSPGFFTSPAWAAGPNRRLVRVALPDTDILTPSGSDNLNVYFTKEYLQAIAEYANWDYVYVPLDWNQCLEQVKTGEADILFDVSKTEERLPYYNYSSEVMGTEMCYLITRSDSRFNYNDFEAFNGMLVGYEDGSTMIEDFKVFAQNNGFTFRTRPYKSSAAMSAAIESGEVEAGVQTNYLAVPEGQVIIAKCNSAPIYIAVTKKKPELKAELDSAMTQLFSYNPNFNADLYNRTFKNNSTRSEGYTQQEKAYLKTRPVVNVIYETNWAPFEYDTNGFADGITPDVLRAIGQDTGIEFRFILSSSTQAVYQETAGATVDTVMAVSYDYVWANGHDLFTTQPYVAGTVMQVTKTPEVQPKSVAVVTDTYMAREIKERFPELIQVSYLTFEECMQAVKKGQADCTFLNFYQANYYRSLSTYDSFSYKPTEKISQAIALGVTKKSNPQLLGILSKSLHRISAHSLQSILSENSVQAEPLSLRVIIRNYPVATAAGIGSFSILLGLLLMMLYSARSRKRQALVLARAKQDAEAASKAKTDFLSRMSHDIRTPLNGIIGMTHIARGQANPATTVECLDKIDMSSKFLLGLVNDILDLSKAESGKLELHPEPYYADDFRRYIAAVIQPLCDSKKQKLIFELNTLEHVVPKLDVLRINQVYFNLLSNAVKFTPEGGTIQVTINEALLPDHRERLTVSVRDNGSGISEEFKKVLFNPFTQEHRNDNSEQRGSGLGLAIVKRIITAMGGTITVQSQVGAGTEFKFTILCDYLEAENEGPAAVNLPIEAFEQLKGRRVLLCEDNRLNQVIAQALLKEKGVAVEVAENGQAGVELFAAAAPDYYDAVLMDIRMPVLDGLAATRTIRALTRADARTVPIIAMTADAFEESMQEAQKAGMNGYVTKPIDPQKLYQELAKGIR